MKISKGTKLVAKPRFKKSDVRSFVAVYCEGVKATVTSIYDLGRCHQKQVHLEFEDKRTAALPMDIIERDFEEVSP